MAHSVFTIVAKVEPKRLGALKHRLDQIKAADGDDPQLRFRALDGLHFASFVIFDEKTAPLLAFEHAVDGSVEAHLRALVGRFSGGIDAVYENCVEYTPGNRFGYLMARVHRPQLYHIGTAYRQAGSIRQDAHLRKRLEERVDQLLDPGIRAQLTAPGNGNGASSALKIWRMLQHEFAALARRPREPRLLERLKNWSLGVALPLAVVSVLVKLFWSHPALLFAAATLAFTVEGVALWILMGWPAAGGTWKMALQTLLPAAAAGAFLGLWPLKPVAALWTGALLLGLLLLGALARLLAAGEARESRGNWRIVPFGLLALGASWALLFGLGAGHWLVTIVGAIAYGLALLVTAALVFIGLVFVSTLKRPPNEEIRIGVSVGGGVALAFYVASDVATRFELGEGWSWFPIVVFAFVLLLGASGLSALHRPSPSAKPPLPSNEHLRNLTAQEDEGVQNHMSVMVHVRQDLWGWRAFVLKLFFHLLNRAAYRTVLPDLWKSTLFGIPTVHFAHWTVLDERRHIFLSNYDFSWTAYLDDFGFKLGKGLQMIWGQSEESPGTERLESFKTFARAKAVCYQVWYRAYPRLTALQIRNNEKLRRGLLAHTDEKESLDLLRRLASLEKA